MFHYILYLVLAGFIARELFRLWIRRCYSYFTRLGIYQLEPTFPAGNAQTFMSTESVAEVTRRFYEQTKSISPVVGFYKAIFPALLINDVKLLRSIFVRDFNLFSDRGIYYNKKDDPLSAHLFMVDGEDWRGMRKKLSPTFSSGKMKYMFATIVAVAEEFVKCVNREIKESKEIEMREILARFTTDVIGSCAFGLECNSLKDPNAVFREMGRKVFSLPPPLRGWEGVVVQFSHTLARKLHIIMTNKEVGDFFMKSVEDTVAYRRNNNIKKNDFFNLLLEIGKDNSEEPLTIKEIAAQAFVFFKAGFETSSTTMSFALFELALNQTVQDKAREEVQTVLARHDGKMTYEAISEMKYIDNVSNESLRKYPPVPVLIRKLTQNNYTFEDTNITIEKGIEISIPVYGIHHDPEHYPNPEVYDPDRFTDEEKQKRDPYAFIPFGEGPRNCIGLRFGLLQSRLGLASLLNNFKFTMSDKTELPLKFKPSSFILAPTSGLYLNIEHI